MRDQALEYLHRELRKAKQAYGRAEHRPGVTQEELENLQRKIDVLDYMLPLVLAGEETGWPVWVLKRALVEVQRKCKETNGCRECFFNEECDAICNKPLCAWYLEEEDTNGSQAD